MNFKDLKENLILAKKLVETGNDERALIFIDQNLNNINFIKSLFVNRSILEENVFLKLKILYDLEKYEDFYDFSLQYGSYIIKNKNSLLLFKNVSQILEKFDKKLLYRYLVNFPYDNVILKKYVYKVFNDGDFEKKDIIIFKRYCLDFKKDFEITMYTIQKIFQFKSYDLKFTTIMLNYFYNFKNRDDLFDKNIIKYVEMIISNRNYWKRKIFYPVFKYYYEKTEKETILPYIFEIIKKNLLKDDFARFTCNRLFSSDPENMNYLSALARINRLLDRQDEEDIKIYSLLYKKNPKNIENTKYLAYVLRSRNDITDNNIDIFLKAFYVFEENEKDSVEYKNLILFMGNYLSENQNYNWSYKDLVEDILRICTESNAYFYAVSFYVKNEKYEKAFFLLQRIDINDLEEKMKKKYYILYIDTFIRFSYYKSFMDYSWQKTLNYLKKLKKYGKHEIAFQIAQFYILRKNQNNLPVCFFSPEKCSPWTEKCFFMNKLDKLRKNISDRELKVIREYIKLSDSKESEVFKKLFVENNKYIPINYDIPMSVCVNLQKLIINDKYEQAFLLFKNESHILDNEGFLFWAAIIFYNIKKYDDAILFFNKVIVQNRDNPYAYFYRGMCFYRKKMFLVAYNDFNKVLDLKIFNEKFLTEILQIYIKERYIKDAQKIVDILYKSESTSSKADYYYSEILYLRKKYEESYNIVERLKDIKKYDANVRLLEIRILIELKKLEEALERCNSFITDIKDNDEIFLLRAIINSELKKYRLVIKDLEKIIYKIPHKYVYTLANAYFNTGDVENASIYLKKYKEKVFFDIKSNILQSQIYMKKNLNREAIKILRITWFVSKSKRVLKELVKANNKLGIDNKIIEYSQKYLKYNEFDKDVFCSYLKSLIKNNKLHLISNKIKNIIPFFDNFDRELKDIFYKALFITGKFDTIINLYEKPSEMIKDNKNEKKRVYIKKKNDLFDFYIYKGNVRLLEIKEEAFTSEIFDDEIYDIFYSGFSGDFVGKLKYFSNRLYSIDTICSIIRPDIYLEDFFKDPGLNFNNLIEFVHKNTEKQKNILFLLETFDTYILELFNIHPKEYEIEHEKNIINSKNLSRTFAPKNSNINRVFCKLKFYYVDELLKQVANIDRKEYFLVYYWESIGKFPTYEAIKNLKHVMKSDIINFFFEDIACPYYSECNYSCKINCNDNEVQKHYRYFDLLLKNSENIKLMDVNRDFIKYSMEENDRLSLNDNILFFNTIINLFSEIRVVYKYNRDIFYDYEEIINLLKNISTDLKSIINYKNGTFFIESLFLWKNSSYLIKLQNNLLIFLNKIRVFIDHFQNEKAHKIDFLNFLVFKTEHLRKAINNLIIKGKFIIYKKDDLIIYPFSYFKNCKLDLVEKDTDVLNLKYNTNIPKSEIDYKFVEYNSLSRIYSIYSDGMYFSKWEGYKEFYNKKLHRFLKNLNNRVYQFDSWNIKDILSVNIYIREHTGKPSILIWPEMDLGKNYYYQFITNEYNKEYSTIIISDINILLSIKDKMFSNVIVFNCNNDIMNIIKKLNYQKLFVNKTEKIKELDRLPYLKIKEKKHNIENLKELIKHSDYSENVYDLRKTDKENIVAFYKKYVSETVFNVKIKDRYKLDLFKFTNKEFNIIIEEE